MEAEVGFEPTIELFSSMRGYEPLDFNQTCRLGSKIFSCLFILATAKLTE